MKKILIILTIVLSFVGIGNVKATDLSLDLVNDYDTYKSVIGEENLNNILNEVLNEYKNTYITSYPYYIVQFNFYSQSSVFTDNGNFEIQLFYSSKKPTYYWLVSTSPGIGISTMTLTFKDYDGVIGRDYHVYDDSNFIFDSTYTEENADNPSRILYMNSISNPKVYSYYPSNYYMSNFDLYIPSINSSIKNYSSGFIFKYDNILIPSLDDSNLSSVVSLDSNTHLIEPYYLYDSDVDVVIPDIEEINLNDYAFVALSLKDYTKDSFETTIQVKGEYCVNAVYDYGLSAKEKYDSSVTDICSPYYDNYTPVRHYVLDNDIKNHAIYYLKAHDINKENKIKVDSSIFNIHYITEEEADNPIININGRDYSILPFDELPSNSIKNTEEGNWPGASEEFSFADIFTAPLDFLKDVWTSITSVFSLITELLSLLPPIMQNFLYASFMLAVVIGLIKIIL